MGLDDFADLATEAFDVASDVLDDGFEFLSDGFVDGFDQLQEQVGSFAGDSEWFNTNNFVLKVKLLISYPKGIF